MRYRVILKRLVDGDFHARCPAGPRGPLHAQAATAEAALDLLRREIEYRLELCPCSAEARGWVELEVVEEAGPAALERPQALRPR